MFVRTAYKCRAYPDQAQASVLNRTFGCVRVVWNRTLAWRHQRYHAEKAGTNLSQANAYLTAMKKPGTSLAWLNEVSSVPLQQAIRHQQVAARYGRRVITVDRWYPSSKTCSACGYRLADLSLKTRTWQCPSCGTRHDRDHNAAKNILAAGLAVAGGDPGHACGADVRHPGSSRVQSAVKQEPRGVSPGIPVLQGGE